MKTTVAAMRKVRRELREARLDVEELKERIAGRDDTIKILQDSNCRLSRVSRKYERLQVAYDKLMSLYLNEDS